MRTRGSCLCGEIAWEADAPLELVSHCHCSRCRKSHGAAFATYGAASAAGFRWLRGRERVCRYESSPGFFRPFCARCGSVVPGEPDAGRVFMPLGCLDDDPGSRPLAHIFVASKAPWHAIEDALPRFDAWPPGFDLPAVPDAPRPAARSQGVGGSCLCGGVAYRLEGQAAAFRHCHCSRCRKARSAAHASNLIVALEQFHWTRGEELLDSYKVPDAKHFAQVFCRTCGSPMPRVDTGRGIAIVPAGTLDQDPGARPSEHIFVGSRAAWYEIADRLPRYDGYAPS
jgi:hypothetical protein